MDAEQREAMKLVDLASRLLEPAEGEVVQGDLAESGESSWQALAGILGLVLRRQINLWRSWRPWCVLTLTIPLCLLLTLSSRIASDHSAIYSWLYLNNWTARYLATPYFVAIWHSTAQ